MSSDIDVFDWDEYMLSCGTTAAPEGLFEHVEMSLNNGIEKSTYVEIIHNENPPLYWIAEIVIVCGHLLNLKLLGSSEEKWCDLTKEKVYQLGWCKFHEMRLDPPNVIASAHDSKYLLELLKSVIASGSTVLQDVLDHEGSTPIDRLKAGMKLEIQSERDPCKFWITTIKRNVGGRLHLEYDGSHTSSKIWQFYTSSSLRYFGYVSDEGPPYKYQHPDRRSKMRQGELISAQLRQSATEAARMPTPKDLFMKQNAPIEHNFSVGMKLEALNPSHMSTFHPATVVKVYDRFHVLVVLDDYLETFESAEGSCWLATPSHPYIFPVGWAKKHGLKVMKTQKHCGGDFDWNEYLDETSCIPSTDDLFTQKKYAYFEGFKISMNLEAVNPLDRGEICVARISCIVEHLLLIEMAHDKRKHWISYDSSEIFPIKWCQIHDYDLTYPLVPEKPEEREFDTVCIQPLTRIVHLEQERCDRIYFNYKCYAGTFISKNKLAQLPKYVGPGPLSLVIKEVMNLIISAAYKPGKLLKDLEHEENQEVQMRLEILKAKLKLSTYHAKVQVASTNEEVPMFCRGMCAKLQACPFLFGPIEISEQCPEKCLLVDKSKFSSSYWTSGGRRKRKKGLHFMTIRARERRERHAAIEESKNAQDSGNESDNSPSSTPQQSEVGTRPNSPDSASESKKLRKKREPKTKYPPMEMKTRGAKLPNFALQIKAAHWGKKEVRTIYNNSLPKKNFSENESDSEKESDDDSISNEIRIGEEHHISGVSDSEEPELKKLQSTPSFEPQPTNFKIFQRGIKKDTEKQFKFEPDFGMKLSSNPLNWSTKDVYDYIISTDCLSLADKLKEEEIDGQAFMKLNLPIMRDYLNLRHEIAVKLGTHVANVVYYYFNHFDDFYSFHNR